MQGKVLFVDPDKCTGCRNCEMVCSVFHSGVSNPSRSRIRILKWEEAGLYLPMTCQHCETPVCTEVCPTKACHRDLENQRVIIDPKKCIGCKTCIMACPFGHPFFDPVDRVTSKCDYCDGNPQCVLFCNPKAVSYIEADRINSERKREAANRLAEFLRRGR